MSLNKIPAGARPVMTTAEHNVDMGKANKDNGLIRGAERLVDASYNLKNGGLKKQVREVNNKVAGRGAMEFHELSSNASKANDLRCALKRVGPFKIREHVAGFFGFGRKADVRAMGKARDFFKSTISEKFPEMKSLSTDLKNNVRKMAIDKDGGFRNHKVK